jgi:glutamate carboxypeptidase
MTPMKAVRMTSCLLAIGLAGPVSATAHRDDGVFHAVQSNRADLLDLLRQIVDIDSGTGDVEGGTKVDVILADRLESLGATVRKEPSESPGLPDNLVAVVRGSGKGRILIVAHIDTVFAPGTAAQRPFSIEGNRARGPGVGDEKGGVVLALGAIKILHDLRFRNFSVITLLVDDSEERGSPGSRKLIESLAQQHDVELNMEPGDPPDALTVWRKGSSAVRIDVAGRAAHAGMYPQNGRNAAVELVHQLSALENVFPHAGDGTTVNLTLLKAGERNNIIPDAASATFSVRFRKPEDFDAVYAKFESASTATSVPDTKVTVSHTSSFPPLIENSEIDALARRAQSIYGELGKMIALSGNGGASESALAMSVGTPALDGLGPVGSDFHSDREWVDLDSVTPRLYLMTRLLMEFGSKPPARSPPAR